MLTFTLVHAVIATLAVAVVTAVGGVPASSRGSAVTGPAALLDAVDTYVQGQVGRLNIPGAALAIVRGDQVVHLQGFGEADSAGRPVTPQTPFYIGSLTKSFTALAVLQLAEAGKLELEAPVQRYLPWFELADRDASASIAVHHLLNQTSGLSELDGNRFWPSLGGLEEIIRAFKSIRPEHPVGTRLEYSNINYSIAGLIVEQVSGQSYADYLDEHILRPLEMRHAYTARAQAIADGLSEGHYYRFGSPRAGVGPLPPVYLPSGLLIASAEDMAHYAIAHLNEGRYHDTSLLSPGGVATLHAPGLPMQNPEYYYAMGWAAGSAYGQRVLRHTGDTGYFHSSLILLPDSGWGVVLLANASGFEQLTQVDAITSGVMSLLTGTAAPDPVSLPVPMRALYWGVLLTPLVLLLGVLYGLWRFQSGTASEPWQIGLTAAIYALIAWACLFKIPGIVPFSLSAMRAFYPELAYGLSGAGAVGFGWALIYLFLNRSAWHLP